MISFKMAECWICETGNRLWLLFQST